MIQVIDFSMKESQSTSEGEARMILAPDDDGTRVVVSLLEVEAGAIAAIAAGDRTRVAYILQGDGAEIAHESGGTTVTYLAGRRSGVYLEPGEEASVAAGSSPLTLLDVSVPKHVGKDDDAPSPSGYFFAEAELRSLVDEKGIRERTFWVNTETGLSDSHDLQLGRMEYAPHGYSPRHVHNPSEGSEVVPEHFYLIEEGIGTVRHDSGELPVGPGNLVLIPAGEWHQLVASDTGLDYIEFQAPFDFVTTMDHDPLGKNWYIKGTDDGTGRPQLWVQS